MRTTTPGTFTYRWYPSLDSSRLGVGTTGDYWLHGLTARDTAYETIATVRNPWYPTANGSSRGVLEVRHGVTGEVGIAPGRLLRTRAAG